jgi:hypothetical protein
MPDFRSGTSRLGVSESIHRDNTMDSDDASHSRAFLRRHGWLFNPWRIHQCSVSLWHCLAWARSGDKVENQSGRSEIACEFLPEDQLLRDEWLGAGAEI